MKNLKRALSFALATVMLVGMMVVGVSAADFGDADKIEHAEAVNTLVTLGVIKGKDDGNFDPEGIVTRAEMAKMICVALNGGTDPVLGTKASPTYTDIKGHWAESYIEYCASLGVVSGRGDGTFDPDATVTASEAAKMLLVAMNYNAKVFEFTGASWAINVNREANSAKLYDGIEDVDVNAGIARDAVAQMIFNAIQRKTMYRTWNQDMTTGNITETYQLTGDSILWDKFGVVKVEGVVVANEYADITRTGSKLPEGKTQIAAITNADEVGTKVTGIAYEITTGADVLGKTVAMYVKPAKTSNLSTRATVVGTPIITEDNVIVETYAKKTASGITSLLKGEGLKVDNTTKYVTNYDLVASYNFGTSSWVGTTISANDRGVKYNAIDTNGDGVVDYVMTQTKSLDKVVVLNATKEYVTLNGAGTIEFDDVVYYDGMAKGDIVMVYTAGGVTYIEEPKTISGTITTYSGDAGDNLTATIDGTKYYGSSLTNSTGLNSLASVMTNTTDGGVFYLDDANNVMAADLTAAVSPETIAYVDKIMSADSYGNTYKAFVFFADGSKGTRTIVSFNGSTKASDIAGLVGNNGLYVCEETDNGVALRNYAANSLSATQYSQTTTVGGHDSVSLDGDVAKIALTGAAVNGSGSATLDVYANSETKFFLHDTTKDSSPTAADTDVTKTGYMKVVTGYASLSSTAQTVNNLVVAYKVVNGTNVALAVYADKSGAPTVAASSKLVFLPNTEWTKNGDNYDVEVMFTGDTETTTITMNAVPVVGLYTYSVNAQGVYTLNNIAANYGTESGYAGKLTNVTDSLLYVGGTQLNNLGDALVFDVTDGDPVETSASFIDGNAYGYAVVDNTTDKNVLAVYVVGKYEIMAAGITIASGTGVASDPFRIDAAASANVTTMAGSNTQLVFKSYTAADFSTGETTITGATTVADGNYFTLGGKDNNNIGITTVYYMVKD